MITSAIEKMPSTLEYAWGAISSRSSARKTTAVIAIPARVARMVA